MNRRDPAVSPVLGEVLMIVLVLILVPMVTISLLNQMPEDRTPTISIKMGSLSQAGELHLYHKGGDWVKHEDIHLTINGIEDISWRSRFLNQTFDLGDNLTLTGIAPGTTISLVTRRAVVFSGVAQS